MATNIQEWEKDNTEDIDILDSDNGCFYISLSLQRSTDACFHFLIFFFCKPLLFLLKTDSTIHGDSQFK